MISKNLVVTNKAGLHARPASIFVSTASKFKSNITVEKEGRQGNGKSLINVLGLCLNMGSKITILADGEDEKEALDALVTLVETRLGEE